MTPNAPGAVVWDVDGTLVDTAELHFQAWKNLFDELSLDFTREDFAKTFGQRNPEIFAILVGDQFDEERLEALGDRKESLYREAARGGVDLLPGVRPLLEQLEQQGFLQGIGTSAPLANVELITEITQSKQYFRAVSSAEDTQRGKPDPQVFQVAAQKLGVEAHQCVVIEDAAAGVEAAKAGGMKCIAVSFVGHHPKEKLRAAGADLVVETLEKVNAQTVRNLLDS